MAFQPVVYLLFEQHPSPHLQSAPHPQVLPSFAQHDFFSGGQHVQSGPQVQLSPHAQPSLQTLQLLASV